jgi:RimJ/RimL family protein N-acetyltransferase
METLRTERMELVPITLPMVEAMFARDRARAEAVADAFLPDAWPGPALVERAFSADVNAIREDPERRLWGDRLMIVREKGQRWVVGSVIFHGRPDSDGIAEVGYGVERDSQGRGLATEATRASVAWALHQPTCHTVQAVTFHWHVASLRVIQKLGMKQVGTREHELLGEMLIFELRRDQL